MYVHKYNYVCSIIIMIHAVLCNCNFHNNALVCGSLVVFVVPRFVMVASYVADLSSGINNKDVKRSYIY